MILFSLAGENRSLLSGLLAPMAAVKMLDTAPSEAGDLAWMNAGIGAGAAVAISRS